MWAFDSWTLDLYLDVLNAYNHRSIEPDAGAERLNYSFFATAGTLSELRSADATSTGQPRATTVDYTAPGTPGPVRLWVVVRDGRGGVGWLERRLQIAGP